MLMTQRQALEVVQRHRGERIIVTTMSSAGLWPVISDAPEPGIRLPAEPGPQVADAQLVELQDAATGREGEQVAHVAEVGAARVG